MRFEQVKGVVREADFTAEMMALYQRMSDISEERYCAEWIMGNEYELWQDAVVYPSLYDAKELRAVADLSERLGGWIVWVDAADPRDGGPAFVPLEAWRAEYARDVSAHRPGT